MSRVFVVQQQMRFDVGREELVPKFNLEPAKQHGELVYLLSPTAGPFNVGPIIKELKEKLVDYSYKDGDYLLLVGNPCIIGWTVSIASRASGGPVKLLQWSGKHQEYMAIDCPL